MRAKFLPAPSLASSFFHRLFILLAGALSCLSPLIASGQSVTFVDAQTNLPPVSLMDPYLIAVDSAGDVFLADYSDKWVEELPRTGTTFGPSIMLPIKGGFHSTGIAVDGAGNLFAIGGSTLVELPKTASGFGPHVTIPATLNNAYSIAIDGIGDVFILDNKTVVELPKTDTDFGEQVTLPFNGLLNPFAIASNGAGDVFVFENGATATLGGNVGLRRVIELPKTGTGYGPQTDIYATNNDNVLQNGVTDSAGNIFFVRGQQIIELPRTATGYGPRIIFLTTNVELDGLAIDSAGNLFVADSGPAAVEFQIHSVNFGAVSACGDEPPAAPSCSETVPLYYNITASGTLGTPKVLTGGTPDLDFTLADAGTCTGAVTAGATCRVDVTYTPRALGAITGSVEITDGSGDVLATTVISGTGVPAPYWPPVATLSAAELEFHIVAVGKSATLPVTITNTGGGTLTISPSINGVSYHVAESTCGAGLTSGNSCTIQVEFAPVKIGNHLDGLTLQTNASSSPTVPLDGYASGLVAGSTLLDFGSIPFGTIKVIPLTVTDAGGIYGTVIVGTNINGHSYKILKTAENTCLAGIGNGQTCTLPVEFSPETVDVHHDVLTLFPTGGAASTIYLRGTATAP